jgi:RNA recognition motif-containing protein
MTRLFIANLSFDKVAETELRDAFEKFGEVKDVCLIRRDGDLSRGFGFVEMATQEDADRAMKDLNGREFFGRRLVVQEATERRNKDA